MTDLEIEFIETILSLKDIPQSPKWHPEGDTLEHVKFIIYGLTFKEEQGIITKEEVELLTWVALFHDLGKIDTFTVDDNGVPHAYGHEKYAKDYINRFREVIPDHIDINLLRGFCYFHMKAHQYMGTKMRVTKKEAFRDQFDVCDFFTLMTFESCDSSLTMYEMLRRTPEYLDIGYLEPIDFYNEVRPSMPWSDDEDFLELITGMMK